MFYYQPNFIPDKFIIIGAGGTGGRLVPLLAQFLKTANWVLNPKIYIVDHDVIEDKNLIRQNFIKLDLGKHKATVLAERYGRAFDVDIIPVVSKVESYVQMRPIHLTSPNALSGAVRLHELTNAMIIICVDSALARRNILTHICRSTYASNTLVIDAGNENDYGQVVLFNPVVLNASSVYSRAGGLEHIPLPGGIIPVNATLDHLPLPAEFYLNMKDREGAASCAELDQTLAINATMATTMMGIIQNFLYRKPMAYHRINISLANGSIPEYTSFNYLKTALTDVGTSNSPLLKYQEMYGLYLRQVDCTAMFTKLDKDMAEFKKKNGGMSPPPLTEITKTKKVKEPA